MVQPANNIVTTSDVSDNQEIESSETIDYDAYFEFDKCIITLKKFILKNYAKQKLIISCGK